jgi:hypothetical protein
MQVLELADEFHLTTADALEICVAAGIVDATARTELTSSQTERWRALATTRREWQERNERVPVGSGSSFGPIPPAPWEPSTDGSAPPVAPTAPAMNPTDPPPLGPGWGTGDEQGTSSVSPYAPAALALAVVSLIFPFVPGFGALALAWYAKTRIERSGGRLTGERIATAAQVVAAIGITFWVLLLAFTIYTDVRDDAAAHDDGQVEIGTLGWDQIQAGDCVRIPRADLTVDEWTELDCAQPHEAEVFAITPITPTTDADVAYPGKASLVPGATRDCKERFEEFVGVAYERSALNLAVFFPTASNWATQDDRTIGCIVFNEDYALVEGTLARSQR